MTNLGSPSSPRFFFFPILALLLLSPIPTSLQANVSLGSSISTQDPYASWISPSGEFAFGFRPLPNSTTSFILAVWFDKIPEKTVVWCANRDNPLGLRSRAELTMDGRLILYDDAGRDVWTRPVGEAAAGDQARVRATSASMTDVGNFVLNSDSSSNRSVWESFGEPTDTILPTQFIKRPGILSSPRSASNFSNGKFQLRLQADGNVVLYLVAVPSGYTYAPYWISGTAGTGLQLVFNETGYITLTQSNGTSISITPGDIVSTREFYHRATLDFDGVFRQYVYPKTSRSVRNWAADWSVVMNEPPNLCLAVLTSEGSGACGFNSICALDEDQRPSCQCPPGYSSIHPGDMFSGCMPEFQAQGCEQGGSADAGSFEMREMRNVDWPLNDYEKYYPTDEDQCRQFCLEDCFCAVAIFKEDRCWKKRLPLSNGKMDYNVSRKTLIKAPKDKNYSLLSVPIPPSASSCREEDRTTLILVVSVLFGGSGLLNVLLLLAICSAFLFSLRRPGRKNPTTVPGTSRMMGIKIRSFTFAELEKATNGFEEEMDRGSFGAVYKGSLHQQLVAVKVLGEGEAAADKGGSEREFEVEVTAIGQTHHRNLARLLGFCCEGTHRVLVYEFAGGGSLAGFLFGSMRPNWERRVQIAVGVARGLAYLHEECHSQVVHCDINPQNVVLDEFFRPMISGLGLAKLMRAEQSRSVTDIRGTRGYVAPEWFKGEPITAKVDVYSFGVLLLEIVCCRRSILTEAEDGVGDEAEERRILADWAYDRYEEGKVEALVKNDEEALGDLRSVEKLAMVAIWCIQEMPEMRPAMGTVTEMIEGAVEIPRPPYPYSSISSLTENGSSPP